MKKKPVNSKLPGRYGRMTAEELDKEVAVFDREFALDNAAPLTAKERTQVRRARRKRRPVTGNGMKRVLISMDRDLLRRCDACAKKRALSRSDLIALGLEEWIKTEK